MSNSEICMKFSILMTLVACRVSKQNYSPLLRIVTNRSLFLIDKDVLWPAALKKNKLTVLLFVVSEKYSRFTDFLTDYY